MQRRILTVSLKRWGFLVAEAGTGEEAVEICREGLPDIVISDWMMPGMSGPDFCRAFRAMQKDTYGYFILLTLAIVGVFGIVNRRLNRHLPQERRARLRLRRGPLLR